MKCCPFCHYPYPEGRSLCLNVDCWVDWNSAEKQALWKMGRLEAEKKSVEIANLGSSPTPLGRT